MLKIKMSFGVCCKWCVYVNMGLCIFCVCVCVVCVCVCMLQTWKRIHKPMCTQREEEDVKCHALSISILRLDLLFNLS